MYGFGTTTIITTEFLACRQYIKRELVGDELMRFLRASDENPLEETAADATLRKHM